MWKLNKIMVLCSIFCGTIFSEEQHQNGYSIEGGGYIKYDAPDDCKYGIGSNEEDVRLVCNLRTVNSDFDTTNFSVIPSENTASLSVLCNDKIIIKSSLKSKSFSHLNKLKELTLEFCKFVKFSKSVLFGLSDLRNLTIRTHNINWPALSLEIDSDSFGYTNNLERLDLSRNNIWSLPERLFCGINNLNWLNISENRLQDISDLGFREKSLPSYLNVGGINFKNSSCSLDLVLLDISYNHFVLLPANGFGSLKRLQFLKIQNNEVSMVADKALSGLKKLQIINLNSNKIVALPSELFQDSTLIEEIYLTNNSISVLSPGLFSNLKQLQALDLSSNQLTSAWINKYTFSGLIRLVLLNLSNNKITKLESELFSDLYTLQILNMRWNQLEIIPAETFSPMNNLHTLLLSHNRIKYMDAHSLNGLYVLSLLSLDNNRLNGLHPEALRNCSALQDLNLNGNELEVVPQAIKDMRLLRTVDLGENHITEIDDISFRGMTNLYGLRLIENQIENVSKNAFEDLPSLQILNLAKNKLKILTKGLFEVIPSIQAIRLDGNLIKNIDELFTNMQNLLWLNISDNKLEDFDFSQIPLSLQWLDLHKNDLRELANRDGLDNQLRLQTLDASFNQLRKVTVSSIPNSIELLFLNDNLISSIEQFTFKHKTNLTRVDLYANQISTLDIKSLRLDPVPNDHLLAEFYIGGNPFICDCNIEWLQTINHLTLRQYPRIMDIETIYCKLLYNRDRSYIQLTDAEPMHFLCSYKSHCFTICHCCEFDACDCEMTCPNNCTCFHDHDWTTNVVECSNSGYTDIPLNIPMDTTEVYIDGNKLFKLSGHSFIGRQKMRILYANNSMIEVIYNTTFVGLKRLIVLHLESNYIYELVGNEFLSLENLKELYLQNNQLAHINNNTFLNLNKLEVLFLYGNQLVNFNVWTLSKNGYLVVLRLSENMWTCDCEYLDKFREYLKNNGDKIEDANKITCVYNNLTAILKERNGTKCSLSEISPRLYNTQEIENLFPLLLAATCVFVGFLGLIIGVFCYRSELKLWVHPYCRTNMCYNPDNLVDKDRVYDAYISYSLQDEYFVNQILSSTLENDVGFRLCLHYRDFNINTYITDAIIDAVESSKRTIFVLTKNYLNNEWARFEYKSAIHEIMKRRKKIIFILHGDLPQRDLDSNMRLYLRTHTCIEWDDKKFWQKLRMVLPHIKSNKTTFLKTSSHEQPSYNTHKHRSPVNIYATTNDFNTLSMGRSFDFRNTDYISKYSTSNKQLCSINNHDNFGKISGPKYLQPTTLNRMKQEMPPDLRSSSNNHCSLQATGLMVCKTGLITESIKYNEHNRSHNGCYLSPSYNINNCDGENDTVDTIHNKQEPCHLRNNCSYSESNDNVNSNIIESSIRFHDKNETNNSQTKNHSKNATPLAVLTSTPTSLLLEQNYNDRRKQQVIWTQHQS